MGALEPINFINVASDNIMKPHCAGRLLQKIIWDWLSYPDPLLRIRLARHILGMASFGKVSSVPVYSQPFRLILFML